MLAFVPPSRAVFSFPSLSCVRRVAALRRGFPTLHRYFNPRSPCGERLRLTTKHFSFFVFQSTLPVWGATAAPFLRHHKPAISIHAPRVGSDCRGSVLAAVFCISIHAPRVGSDQRSPTTRPPTPNFNPRSPCGERPVASGFCAKMSKISIHAPRVGSDGTGATTADAALEFQSTLPVWGATLHHVLPAVCPAISIHAPRVGSDTSWNTSRATRTYFNPRSPCGERPAPGQMRLRGEGIFQSPLPVWGATCSIVTARPPPPISIHAPRVGSDRCCSPASRM